MASSQVDWSSFLLMIYLIWYVHWQVWKEVHIFLLIIIISFFRIFHFVISLQLPGFPHPDFPFLDFYTIEIGFLFSRCWVFVRETTTRWPKAFPVVCHTFFFDRLHKFVFLPLSSYLSLPSDLTAWEVQFKIFIQFHTHPHCVLWRILILFLPGLKITSFLATVFPLQLTLFPEFSSSHHMFMLYKVVLTGSQVITFPTVVAYKSVAATPDLPVSVTSRFPLIFSILGFPISNTLLNPYQISMHVFHRLHISPSNPKLPSPSQTHVRAVPSPNADEQLRKKRHYGKLCESKKLVRVNDIAALGELGIRIPLFRT